MSKEVITELEMVLEAAQELNFEKAALLRNQIDLLKNKAKGSGGSNATNGFKKEKAKECTTKMVCRAAS